MSRTTHLTREKLVVRDEGTAFRERHVKTLCPGCLRVVRMFGRFVPKDWPLIFIASRLACEARRAEENNKNGTLCSVRPKEG